jgi:hypothetical protein
MPIVSYTKTSFIAPDPISEEVYLQIKRKINSDPEFNIDPSPETFSEHFKSSLSFIKWGLGYCFAWALVYSAFFEKNIEKDSPVVIIFNIPAIVGGLGSLIAIFNLLLEGPSFATYVKEKENYFNRLKYAIKNSKDYRDFATQFYR